MRLLILKNENREIAIRHMCRHATGDIAAVAGRRIKYFRQKCWIKDLKVPDFGRFPSTSTYLHLPRASRLNQAHFKPPSCTLWHMPPINSTFLLPPTPPILSLYSSFPNSSGKWNHNNISPETQSILFLTSSKQNRGYWSLSERLVEILCVCVQVDQLRNSRRGWRECSL